MQNIALDRPAIQSSTSQWSIDPASTVDARTANNGDTVTNRFFHTAAELNPWWQVELENLSFVKRIVIYNRLDIKHRLNRLSVLRSSDGEEWFDVFTRNSTEAFEVLTIDIDGKCAARFIRIRLNGYDFLHFRECQVFGSPCEPAEKEELLAEDARLVQRRRWIPEGRTGRIIKIEDFSFFVDDKYGEAVKSALIQGGYEGREIELARECLLTGDRVLEIGTAIGAVSTIAASILGESNVLTFDANPEMVADAQDNFQRNNLGGIKCHVAALANRKYFKEGAFVRFLVSQDFWASRMDLGGGGDDIVKVIGVPVRCLEEEIEAHQANVILCDIEGGEVVLFDGADLSSIRLIIMETHHKATGDFATDTMVRNLILQGFALHVSASNHGIVVLRRL